MKISLFNRRITFEKNEVTVDSIGNHKNTWTEYFSCYAYVSASSYKEGEKEAAGLTVQEIGLVFSVRFCSELEGLTAGNYRIRFQGDTYDITSIDWMNYQNKQIKIQASKERRE